MANNLFVSYDLHEPSKNYEAVIEAIKGISGRWAKIHYSYWYVKTTLTATQVRDQLWKVMDSNDSLCVIDTNNNAAAWQHLSEEVSKYLQDQWYQ